MKKSKHKLIKKEKNIKIIASYLYFYFYLYYQ
jgi:hypothetical protein